MEPYGTAPVKRTEAKAVVSLFLGVASMVFGPATGVPAMILGSVARRDIDRSSGRMCGRTIAGAGTLVGLFGTGFWVVALLWIGSAFFIPAPETAQTNSVSAIDKESQAKVTAPQPNAPRGHADVEPLHVASHH